MVAQTMGFESDSNSERWHLGRKLTLLFLLVLALTLGLVILFRQRTDFPLLAFDLFADVSLGVIVGLAVRFVLQQRNWFIQGLVSTALVVIGLFILGYLNNGKSGIAAPPIQFTTVHWLSQWNIPLKVPTQIRNSSMNWFALIQLIMVIDVSWLALRAWKRTSSDVTETSAESLPAHQRSRSARTNVLPRFNIPKIHFQTSGTKSKVRRKRSGSLITKSATPKPMKSARTRSWNPLHQKPQIQLAVYEEHKCPYCLTEVKRNDPRGVVECEVCHALHHKDCWDITGACQVPHLNT